ncbi:MAG: transcriptional regulator [Clostridiales bacterium]|nr:transcriptional regulator [Clostridiales bacterium]
MKTFSDKIKQARSELNLNQQQLADIVGISKRSIAAYETTDTKPRGTVVKKLAKALNVSVDYLFLDEIDDPRYGLERSPYIETVRERYGGRAAAEMEVLLEQNMALFAGGTLDQEAKDAFFEALMKAYLTCKEEARKTYGRRDK